MNASRVSMRLRKLCFYPKEVNLSLVLSCPVLETASCGLHLRELAGNDGQT
uniref:Uncharacterized protein n=1 Tax=Hyaloperonospora arabidopsidis (strain Emoy2) TaxID=559515 RepID=M4BM33_HYAAE